ncbi:hypothetical protein Hanom_Chr06g00578991 [Helianthus anomalus]
MKLQFSTATTLHMCWRLWSTIWHFTLVVYMCGYMYAFYSSCTYVWVYELEVCEKFHVFLQEFFLQSFLQALYW